MSALDKIIVINTAYTNSLCSGSMQGTKNSLGYRFSEEQRARLSDSKRGRPLLAMRKPWSAARRAAQESRAITCYSHR